MLVHYAFQCTVSSIHPPLPYLPTSLLLLQINFFHLFVSFSWGLPEFHQGCLYGPECTTNSLNLVGSLLDTQLMPYVPSQNLPVAN